MKKSKSNAGDCWAVIAVCNWCTMPVCDVPVEVIVQTAVEGVPDFVAVQL